MTSRCYCIMSICSWFKLADNQLKRQNKKKNHLEVKEYKMLPYSGQQLRSCCPEAWTTGVEGAINHMAPQCWACIFINGYM